MQIAQACHAALDFAIKFPDKARKWSEESNYICVLQVADETELLDYADLAHAKGYDYIVFHDPDVDASPPEQRTGSYTALAIEPGEFYVHLSSLPLALRTKGVAVAA